GRHPQPRLSGRAGRRDADRGARHDHQPRRGPPLRGARPAGEPVVSATADERPESAGGLFGSGGWTGARRPPLFATAICLLLVIAALGGGAIAPYVPDEADFTAILAPPA